MSGFLNFITSPAGISSLTALVILVILAGIAFVVLRMWFSNPKLLEYLVSEPPDDKGNCKASLSRFQMLLFTFVIAGLFLALSLEAGTFVEIPAGVLGLIGISSGTYVLSKYANK